MPALTIELPRRQTQAARLAAALSQIRGLEPDEVRNRDAERQFLREEHLHRLVVQFQRVLARSLAEAGRFREAEELAKAILATRLRQISDPDGTGRTLGDGLERPVGVIPARKLFFEYQSPANSRTISAAWRLW